MKTKILLQVLFSLVICVEVTFGEVIYDKIRLKDLINSCPDISDSVSSRWVNPKIAGQKVQVNGKLYEIRYFSFEDTLKSLPSDMTFKEYVTKNNLLEAESAPANPMFGIDFQCFDFRFANLNDKVYYSMALRIIE